MLPIHCLDQFFAVYPLISSPWYGSGSFFTYEVNQPLPSKSQFLQSLWYTRPNVLLDRCMIYQPHVFGGRIYQGIRLSFRHCPNHTVGISILLQYTLIIIFFLQLQPSSQTPQTSCRRVVTASKWYNTLYYLLNNTDIQSLKSTSLFGSSVVVYQIGIICNFQCTVVSAVVGICGSIGFGIVQYY